MDLPELYWIGIGLWLAGFLLYLDGSYWRPSARVNRAGSILCWIGFLTTIIVVANWLEIVNKSVGWVGFAIGIAAVAVSWTDSPRIQTASFVVAVVMMLILAISASRKRRKPRSKHVRGQKSFGAVEHELSVLCLYDKQLVQRLIEHEQSRRPGSALDCKTAFVY